MKMVWFWLVALATCGVAAYDCTGHIFVATIAWQQVSQSVVAGMGPLVDQLALRYPTVSTSGEVACWPDDIKSWTSQYSNWHYYDGCYSVGGYPCPSTPDGMLPTALAAAEQGLANKSLSIAERAFWFAFVLHLVGDAHQPLHVCEQYSTVFPTGDVGGNKFLVQYNGAWTGLHELLDNGVDDVLGSTPLQRPLAQYPSLAKQFNVGAASLFRNLSSSATSEDLLGDLNFATWQAEGFELCTRLVYANLTNGSTVNQSYVDALRSSMRTRVALAGGRLAAILTRALAEPSSTPKPPPLSLDVAATLAAVSGASVAFVAVFAVAKNTWCRRVRDRELMADMAYESGRFR